MINLHEKKIQKYKLNKHIKIWEHDDKKPPMIEVLSFLLGFFFILNREHNNSSFSVASG